MRPTPGSIPRGLPARRPASAALRLAVHGGPLHLAPYGRHPTQRSAAWHARAISGRGSGVDSPTLVALGITHRGEVVPGPAVRKPERAHRPDQDIE